MENKNIDNMIVSIIDGDKDSFSSSFSSEMKDRLTSKFVEKSTDISKDILKATTSEEIATPPTDHVTDNSSWEKYKKENSKSVEEAYGKRGPSSYTFKNPNDSKKFIKAAMNAGLNKKYIRVQKNKVTIDVSKILIWKKCFISWQRI